MNWLTRGGLAAALLVGITVWWRVGPGGLVPLLAFLLTGSLLTRWAEGRAARRTARQVLANGGAAVLAALWGSWPAFAGAIAAATADTWATEIGRFSPHLPRLITTGTTVPVGSSGGITLLGTVGGIGGALTIAALSLLVAPLPGAGEWEGGRTFSAVSIAGVVGMLVDSLLGATLQASYACPGCGTRIERPGDCHGRLKLARGLPWLDNDAVNLAGALTGALAGAAGYSLWS